MMAERSVIFLPTSPCRCGMWLSINYTAALWLTMAFMTGSNGDYSYQVSNLGRAAEEDKVGGGLKDQGLGGDSIVRC